MASDCQAAFYLRVSTPDQRPDLQVHELRAYASRMKMTVVGESLDIAISGRKEGQPQLTTLMVEARARRLDCVLVWKLDRFARSTSHLLRALEDFDHLGIHLVSVRDQIDTGSSMGKAMFTLIGAMAELESSLIRERVTAGMKAAQARGKRQGHLKLPPRVILEVEHLGPGPIPQLAPFTKRSPERRAAAWSARSRNRSESKDLSCDRFLYVS